jgi:hypothetical protein
MAGPPNAWRPLAGHRMLGGSSWAWGGQATFPPLAIPEVSLPPGGH